MVSFTVHVFPCISDHIHLLGATVTTAELSIGFGAIYGLLIGAWTSLSRRLSRALFVSVFLVLAITLRIVKINVANDITMATLNDVWIPFVHKKKRKHFIHSSPSGFEIGDVKYMNMAIYVRSSFTLGSHS